MNIDLQDDWDRGPPRLSADAWWVCLWRLYIMVCSQVMILLMTNNDLRWILICKTTHRGPPRPSADLGIVYFPNKAWILFYIENYTFWLDDRLCFYFSVIITNEFPRKSRRGIKFFNTIPSQAWYYISSLKFHLKNYKIFQIKIIYNDSLYI